MILVMKSDEVIFAILDLDRNFETLCIKIPKIGLAIHESGYMQSLNLAK